MMTAKGTNLLLCAAVVLIIAVTGEFVSCLKMKTGESCNYFYTVMWSFNYGFINVFCKASHCGLWGRK